MSTGITEQRPYHVLFLCTGNSARSILAESLMNMLGKGRFIGHSAGSYPKGAVHPQALALIQELGLPSEGLRSKSWDEFATAESPPLNFIITVCDNAAGEVCPIWPGHPVTAHWGLPDPAGVEGNDAARAAFRSALHALDMRIRLFLDLPHDKLDNLKLQDELRQIGRTSSP